jgi:hypothetical protein
LTTSNKDGGEMEELEVEKEEKGEKGEQDGEWFNMITIKNMLIILSTSLYKKL